MKLKKTEFLPASFFLMALFFTVLSGAALAGPGGKPFSDPAEVQEMPGDWEEQPVDYAPPIGDADLVITLDQHLYPALLPLIGEFAEKKGLEIVTSKGTCGVSAGNLALKEVDIAGFCCPPGRTDRMPGVKFHTLGVVPLALIVHPDNPVEDLTLEQARAFFRGSVYRWSEIEGAEGHRGPDFPVLAVGRLHCSLRPGHWKLLLGDEDLFSPRLKEVGAMRDMISLVAANPGAIGYESIEMIRRYREAGEVKVLKIDGRDPNDLNSLSAGRYPLYRTLSVTTWEGESTANPHARQLVEYLLRNAGRVGSDLGIIPWSRLKEAGWQFREDELIGEPPCKTLK